MNNNKITQIRANIVKTKFQLKCLTKLFNTLTTNFNLFPR